MKYLILSDIHGSAQALQQVLPYFTAWNCNYIILLGDILYHGPRNDLPQGYAPKIVVSLLNDLKDKIIAVRGNCEAEVDQMVLEFPCMAEYSLIMNEGKRFFLTHGHHFNPEHLPALSGFDAFLYGHTHLYQLEKKGSLILFNPGSIAIPKGGNEATFGLLDDKSIELYRLDGTLVKKLII